MAVLLEAVLVLLSERINTGGRVVAASNVAKQRIKTVGRVGVAGGVAKERTSTNGRVRSRRSVLLLERAGTGGRVLSCRWCC